MGKKGIIISCIIWTLFLVAGVMEKYSINQIIYVQSIVFAIIISVNRI